MKGPLFYHHILYIRHFFVGVTSLSFPGGFLFPLQWKVPETPSDGIMCPFRVPVTLGRGRGWYRFFPGTILLRFRFSRGSGVLYGYSGILEGKTVRAGFRYPGVPGSCSGFLGPGCLVTTGFRFPVRVFIRVFGNPGGETVHAGFCYPGKGIMVLSREREG